MVNFSRYILNDITKFIVYKTGCEECEVSAESDLLKDLGCSGDDFDELIKEFSTRFNVDMTSYLWYFHSDEEGHASSIGRIFFLTPYERVKHIPITPTLLLDSANRGKWSVTYPDHLMPRRRYDILINQIMALLFIVFLIYKCSK